MLNVYYSRVDDLNFGDLSERYWNCLSEERKASITKYKFEIDKIRSITAEIMLRKALLKDFNISNEEIKFERNYYGKPRLTNKNIEFNISHSGNFVVLAISNDDVGIDIEERKKYHHDIVQLFHEKEISIIENNSLNGRVKVLYDYWCLKESYIKFIGKGLSEPLNSSFIIKEAEKYQVYLLDNTPIDVEVFPIDIDENYSCAVCTNQKNITKIENIDQATSL